MYQEIYGDLIDLAKDGQFDVIVHGCNCFCTMGAGIAPRMAGAFGADKFPMEDPKYRGLYNKLGTIDYKKIHHAPVYRDLTINGITEKSADFGGCKFYVVNAYTQYGFGKNHDEGTDIPLDYDALTLCLRKINHNFKGLTVGLPQIGCGLAGGDWKIVKKIIKKELKDCNIVVVIFNK